jgi:small conductance mechanosensitive channel
MATPIATDIITPTITPEVTSAPVSKILEMASDKADSTWTFLLPYIKNVGLAILIIVIGLIVIGFIKRTIKGVFRKSKRIDNSLASFLVSVIDITLKILLFLVILTTLGVETTSIVAVIGAASLAIGIALQGALSNFAAGFMLMVFKPYKADDFVKCGSHSGVVYDVNIFSTQLKTIDNKIINIPNSVMINGPLTNYSANKLRRVDINVSVDYNSDIDKVKKVLTDIMFSHKQILNEPAPIARVIELAESSLDFTVRAWVKAKDYWDVKFDLNESIKKSFDENRITIPYPHITIVEKNK